jgi:hypothetical protein
MRARQREQIERWAGPAALRLRRAVRGIVLALAASAAGLPPSSALPPGIGPASVVGTSAEIPTSQLPAGNPRLDWVALLSSAPAGTSARSLVLSGQISTAQSATPLVSAASTGQSGSGSQRHGGRPRPPLVGGGGGPGSSPGGRGLSGNPSLSASPKHNSAPHSHTSNHSSSSHAFQNDYLEEQRRQQEALAHLPPWLRPPGQEFTVEPLPSFRTLAAQVASANIPFIPPDLSHVKTPSPLVSGTPASHPLHHLHR